MDKTMNEPRVARKQQPSKRVTQEEFIQFRQLVLQAYNTLQEKSRLSDLFQRQVWAEISTHLHVMGWPKRSWIHLRSRGEKILEGTAIILKKSLANNKGINNDSNAVRSPPPQTQQNFSNTSLAHAISTPIPLIALHELSNGNTPAELSHSIFHKQTSSTVVKNPGPPPLVPSTEALAMLTGPQILRVVSRAPKANCTMENRISPAEYRVDSIGLRRSPKLPSMSRESLTSNGSNQTHSDRIDLFAYSDTNETVESGIQSACSTQTSPSGNNAIEGKVHELTNTPATGVKSIPLERELSKDEFVMRMRVYERKLEVLQWKKAYWAMKFRSLKQNCTTSR